MNKQNISHQHTTGRGRIEQKQRTGASYYRKSGFSLIELLIATGLVTILFLTVSAMFMTFLLGNSSITLRKRISTEGNQALKTMDHHIRWARRVVMCDATSITVEDVNGGTNTLSYSSNVLYLNGTSRITSPSVRVTGGTVFSCTITGNRTFVRVSFNLQAMNGSVPVAQPIEPFTSNIQVRN